MRKIYLFIFIAVICILLLGCAAEKKVLLSKIADTEEEEVAAALDELQDLDTLSEGMENVTFDELENASLE